MVTLDDIVALVHKTVLNPLLPISLLGAVVLRDPSQLQVVARGAESYNVPNVIASSQIKALASTALAGILTRTLGYLNRQALNNGLTDTYDWSKEIVVVTGGSGGIGGEVVRQLSAKGTKIAVLDVMPLTYSKPPNVEFYQCDLMNEASLRAAADNIRANWGDPTVLCAIAGIVRAKPLLESSKRDFDLTFGVNTIAVALCYKEFAPSMVKTNHGHIVTMASQTAYASTGGMVDYGASKSATLALHEGLQTELKHYYNAPRVRCTVILPSIVATKMFTGLASPSQFLFPVLTPEQVARSIVEALWSSEAQHVELPWLMSRMSPLTRAMPIFYRVGMQDGAKDIMKTYSGHKIMD